MVAELAHLPLNALSPRGQVDEETCSGDAPEERAAYPSGYGGQEQCGGGFCPCMGKGKLYLPPDGRGQETGPSQGTVRRSQTCRSVDLRLATATLKY